MKDQVTGKKGGRDEVSPAGGRQNKKKDEKQKAG